MMLIFLDIDGVLCLNGRRMDESCVANLNLIVEAAPTPARIVFNTAWNNRTLQEMRAFLTEAGFLYPETLYSQTAGCEGGGSLIQRWLRDNEMVGTPYLIVDDSTRVGALWCRLAHCRSATGITSQVVEKALTIMTRPIYPMLERLAAIESIATHSEDILNSQWLTMEQRMSYIDENAELMRDILKEPDFLRAACLRA